MPVEFAVAARGQAHVDAGDVLRGGQFTLRDLVGPAPFLDPFLDQVERIPQRDDIAVIGWRRIFESGFSSSSGLFSWPGSLEE
jgi:hypothetical protein